MTDDRERDDPAGWFAAQFGSHDDDTTTDDTANDVGSGDENPGGEDSARENPARETSGSLDPLARTGADDGAGTPDAAPSAPASGGFTWGLTPSNAPERPTARPAAPESPVEPAQPTEPEPPTEPAQPTEPLQPPIVPPPASLPPVVPPIATPPNATPPVATPPFLPPAPVGAATSPFAPPLVPPPLVEPEPPLPATSVFAPPPLVAPPLVPPTEPQPFDAALAGGPSSEAEPPTVAMPWEGPATELFAPPVASASVAEPATELLGGFEPGAGASADGSPVDELFGESQFREYQTGSLAAVGSPSRSATTAQPAAPRPPRAPIPRSQRVLFWIAGSLAALLVLVVLFFLGTKLPRAETAPAAIATPKASATPTPSPTPTVLPAGPLAAGSYKWDELLGGECLEPFASPWAEKFTVVDCAVPHPAQMVARGVFAETPPAAGDGSAPATPSVGGEASSYPGVDALQAQINLLCTTPSVIDFAAAGAYSDIQILGSYPATAKQWADGERSYFCFVTRSSGEPLAGSVAVPKAP